MMMVVVVVDTLHNDIDLLTILTEVSPLSVIVDSDVLCERPTVTPLPPSLCCHCLGSFYIFPYHSRLHFSLTREMK